MLSPDGLRIHAVYDGYWHSGRPRSRNCTRTCARSSARCGAHRAIQGAGPRLRRARLAFDDLAVQQARRELLQGQPYEAVTTLLTDDSHFEGSLLVARGEETARLADDPFARVFPPRLLHVGPGVLGRVPWPASPVIERYGSAQPWPADRF